MKHKDFEDYMQEMHMEDNPMLLDDELPDHYGEWLAQLDAEEWLEYGNAYKNLVTYCTCKDSSYRCPGNIKTMRCDYCGKPPRSLDNYTLALLTRAFEGGLNASND